MRQMLWFTCIVVAVGGGDGGGGGREMMMSLIVMVDMVEMTVEMVMTAAVVSVVV